jgi:hypothetical protein
MDAIDKRNSPFPVVRDGVVIRRPPFDRLRANGYMVDF